MTSKAALEKLAEWESALIFTGVIAGAVACKSNAEIIFHLVAPTLAARCDIEPLRSASNQERDAHFCLAR